MPDVDPVLRAVGKALWDAYGYTLPDAPEAVARVALEAVRAASTLCDECDWWAAGTAHGSALRALLEHRKSCKTAHPGGAATGGAEFEGYR